MSADSDPAPDLDAESSEASAQPYFPQAKRRYKREPGSEGAPADDWQLPEGMSVEDGLRKEISRLNARLRVLAERPAPPPSAETETRGAKYFRLQRKGTAPVSTREPGAAAPESAPALPLPANAQTARVASYEPRRNTNWLLLLAGALGLSALAFFLGWQSNNPSAARHPAVPAPPVIATWSEADMTQLDQVFDLAHGGNPQGAYAEATRLDRQLDHRPSLEAYAALLEVQSGALNNAEADLIRKADVIGRPSRETVAVQTGLGFVFARRRDFKSASGAFAAAAAADPFDPRTFYYWGESLRRTGQVAEAVAKFREALLRLPANQPESDSLAQCAALRMRLSQIELGDDHEVKTALDAQLRRPVPSVYWLLTAVAYDLQHGDTPAALAVLQRIGVVSPPELVNALLNDYFLRSFATHDKAVAAYFPELTAERRQQLEAGMACFIDP